MQDPRHTPIPRNVYSVSQLTDRIKALLENEYSMVWISGEISNLRIPPSGHAYFTLKDSKAQISAVMFRGQLRQCKFEIEDGMVLIALGRVTVYPPRGNYQIILEYIEPHGAGALQIAFEQLKRKLSEEGLFGVESKTPLPFLPRRIGVITSPSGAVIQDMIRIFSRRFNNLILDIYPVRVQGVEAPKEIIRAIQFANRIKRDDLLVLARGGGSLEDLSPFNDEGVARAIFSSQIPLVSAVGHETDYTIADFVADTRAPTPSAAAEITVPVKSELQARVAELRLRCERSMRNTRDRVQRQLEQLNRRVVHPGKRIEDFKLHVDQLGHRARKSLAVLIQDRRRLFEKLSGELDAANPTRRLDILRSKVDLFRIKVLQNIRNYINSIGERYKTANALLGAVNPTSILNRGYAITRTLPEHRVVMDAGELVSGQMLEIQLAHGKVDVSVIAPKAHDTKTEE